MTAPGLKGLRVRGERPVGGVARRRGRPKPVKHDVVTQIAALAAVETGGGQVPAWLAANLPALIAMVRASRPLRTRKLGDVREALDTIERTAGRLTSAASSSAVMSCLAETDPFVSSRSWGELLISAPDIARRASLALDLVPEGQGRGSNSAGPPSLPNKLRCAAIVSEIWQALRTRREVPSSDHACHAADLLWRASGRASRGTAHAAERWKGTFEKLAAAEKDHPCAFETIRAAVLAQAPDPVADRTPG